MAAHAPRHVVAVVVGARVSELEDAPKRCTLRGWQLRMGCGGGGLVRRRRDAGSDRQAG